MNTISHYIKNSYSAPKDFSITKNNRADFLSSKSDSILDSTQKYAESLRQRRQQAKDTSLKLKSLKYQHKDISSKILRAKTSAAAKQAVSSARREIIKLKRQRLDPDCDPEELEAAISHAKAMERVARKKVKHLELEEMAKATGHVLGENEDTSSSKPNGENSDENIDDVMANEDEASSELPEGQKRITPELSKEQMLEMAKEFTDSIETMAEEFTGSIETMTDEPVSSVEDMLEDLEDGMEEMLEEMGFGELSEAAGVYTGNMGEDDIKTMEVKHRNSEMKDIVKADADYLKVMFEHFQETIDVSV